MTKVSERSFTVHWISFICKENFSGFCFICTEIAALLKAFVGKTFTINQKSIKTVSRLAFNLSFIVLCLYRLNNRIAMQNQFLSKSK